MGEASARHSLRLLFDEGELSRITRALIASREGDVMCSSVAQHPQCHSGAPRTGEPGIHNHDREYGFRARPPGRPGMTMEWSISSSPSHGIFRRLPRSAQGSKKIEGN